MDKRRLGKMKEALPGEELLTKPITRRGLLAGAGATSLAVLLAACGGNDEEAAAPPAEPAPAEPPRPSRRPRRRAATDTGAAPPTGAAPLKEGLAEGMYGGPVGLPGAERYQYPDDSEEGRAIAALRQLQQDGTAPDTLIIQVLNFARPQFEQGFPEGAQSHRGALPGGDGNQDRVRRDRARPPSTRRTCATPRRRTAASTS